MIARPPRPQPTTSKSKPPRRTRADLKAIGVHVQHLTQHLQETNRFDARARELVARITSIIDAAK